MLFIAKVFIALPPKSIVVPVETLNDGAAWIPFTIVPALVVIAEAIPAAPPEVLIEKSPNTFPFISLTLTVAFKVPEAAVNACACATVRFVSVPSAETCVNLTLPPVTAVVVLIFAKVSNIS